MPLPAPVFQGMPGSRSGGSRESSTSPARDPHRRASLQGAALPEVYEAQIRKMAAALERADQEKARLESELQGVVCDRTGGLEGGVRP